MLDLVVQQLVQVEPTQAKQLFVMPFVALVLQVHLQPLSKKRPHRLA